MRGRRGRDEGLGEREHQDRSAARDQPRGHESRVHDHGERARRHDRRGSTYGDGVDRQRPGPFVGSPTCTYTGGAATASCTVTITSAVAGATVVSATSNIPVSGVTITRTTGTAANTAAGGSGNATKWWFTPFALYGAGFGPSPFPSLSVSAYSKPLGTTMGLFQITDTGGMRYVRVQCLVRAGDRIWVGGTVYNDTHQPSLTGHTVLVMIRDAGATGDTWTYITDLSPAAAGQTLAARPLIDSTGLPQYPGNFFTIGL